jgi:iron complex outermembrane receptor protein
MILRLLGLLLLATVPGVTRAGPVQALTDSVHLADLSLEQLRQVPVFTVSRQEERLADAAAAIYVISADDIRRSGATTIPEALRLAPSLDVARADANQYAISARGFNNVLANKMLVLIDGRTVYSPLFSGVFWEAQDTLLEDIDRIEVITGPATAMWGTNAVNGLINVITRRAATSAGTSVAASLGETQRVASVRHGWRLGDGAHGRVYAKSWNRRDTARANGSSVNDQGDGGLVGLRADAAGEAGHLMLQAEASQGTIDPAPIARTFRGAHLLARWEGVLAGGRSLTAQGFVERTERRHPGTFQETLDTADLVVELGMQAGPDHRVLLGAGYRQSRDDVQPFPALAFLPGKRRLEWLRLYAQDQATLGPTLKLTGSMSLEHNPYTGLEVLPSLRLAWRAGPNHLGWAAWSRSARAPSRVDREFFQPGQPPFRVAGGPDFESEISQVLEVGWRAQPAPAWSWDLAAFHHEHRGLRSMAPTPAGLQFRNDIDGRVSGLRGWSRWRATPSWRLDAGFVLMRQQLRLRPGAVDAGGLASLGNDPRHGWSLRSSLDLGAHVAWDLAVRRVGARPAPAVPAYTAVDTRLAWMPARGWELALLVNNLADPAHPEWGVASNRVEHRRAATLQVRWQP